MAKCRSVVIGGLGILIFSCGLNAKDVSLKVGWVSQQAVGMANEGVDLEKGVTEFHRKLSAGVEEKQRAYTEGATALNNKAAALSVEAREIEAEKVNDLKVAYEKAARNAEQTMQRKMQEATQEALKSFSLAAEEYAKQNGFDVLLSEAGVVYVNKEVDNTKEVSAIMNKNYEIKLAENKKADKASAPVKTAAASKTNVVKTATAPAVKSDVKTVAKASPAA